MLCLSLATVLLVRSALAPAVPTSLPAVVTHDNRQAAGSLRDGVLTLDLTAQVGLWRLEGDAGRAIRVEVFGEAASAPVLSRSWS